MKKILLLLTLTLPLLAQARKDQGTTTIYPRIGLNWSKFTGDKIYTGTEGANLSSKYLTGFTGGVEVQHQFNHVIAASIGALYSRQGTSFEKDPEMGQFNMKTDNILVPVLFVATSRIGVDFKLGLQPEFVVHTSYHDVFRKVNLSMPVGLAYEWQHFALDVRYNIGLTKIYKHADSYDKSHGSTFLITLGYAFDL